MDIKDKILVVEDEKNITNLLKAILVTNGYDVITASTGAEAFTMVNSHCPDLMLLDLGLPDIDGMTIIEMCRQWSSIPIIVVSARNHEQDKVAALEMGADDYIAKPLGAAELLARIKVALRHSRASLDNSALVNVGKLEIKDLVVDFDKHQVLIRDENTHLTQNEFKIVSLLAKYSGKVLTYDFIMKEIWGNANSGNNQILRVNMANIRRKIEKNPAQPEYIFTDVGVGYRMVDE